MVLSACRRHALALAAALLSCSGCSDDPGKRVAVEGGVGIMLATEVRTQRYEYFLEIDLQGIVAGDLDDETTGDAYRERYSVPISLGLIWSWGRPAPRR